MARDPADSVTLALPGVTRRGRPVTGCAKSAAERMRAYRARRAAQRAEFPLPVTEIPDEWQMPVQDPDPLNDQPALRRGLLQQIQCYAMTRRFADPERFRNFGNLERNNCRQILCLLGGLASPW